MKTIKQYYSGCGWCSATGIVKDPNPVITGDFIQVCPVCAGSKLILVTETITDENEKIDSYIGLRTIDN